MKKVIVLLAGIALLFLGTTARATLVDPSTIHLNDGTTYLYMGETHPLGDGADITLLSPDVTISNLFIGLAVAGDTPGDTFGTVGTVSGTDSNNNSFGPTSAGSPVGYVDGTQGQKFAYDDVLGVPGNNSQNYDNYHTIDLAVLGIDGAIFDIYRYETGATLFKGQALTATFSDLPLGTFVFAYGAGDDGKFYCTPITETGLYVPEPATLLLFGTGLIGLAGISRKRNKC